MTRLAAILAALAMLLLISAPALADTGAVPDNGRTLISIDGDISLPAGEEAAAVIVIKGDALIEGTSRSVVVISGTATLRAAHVDTLAIVDGTAALEAGTLIDGDVLQLNSAVSRADGVTVGGEIRPLTDNLANWALILGAAVLLLWIGFALATLVAGLALAAFAARQLRTAEAVISSEPLKAFVTGLAMVVVPPLVVVLLAATFVGLPLALGLLLFIWPALAFIGYLVAAIWIGERLLRALGRRAETERPYLAAVVGLIVAGVLGIVPLFTAIISIFGLGAVTVAGWRTLTHGGTTARPSFQPQPAPAAG
jgi:hypothetical protein